MKSRLRRVSSSVGRPGWTVFSLGLVIALVEGRAQSGLSLWVDPTTYLAPNTPNQVVPVYLTNGTGSGFPVIGGTFYFQIDDGDATTGPAPSITGVSISDISGNPFISTGLSANVGPTSTQYTFKYWDVAFITLPLTPLTPVNLTATTYTFAEVTIDTTGFNTIGDSWAFKIINTIGATPGVPYFDIEDPSDPTNTLSEYPVATNGSIQIGVAPIPEVASSGPGIGVVGLALLSFISRRRRHSRDA